MDWRMSFLYLKGSEVMLEIADKEDIKRLKTELTDLRTRVNNLNTQVDRLTETNEALKNLIRTLGGKYTY